MATNSSRGAPLLGEAGQNRQWGGFCHEPVGRRAGGLPGGERAIHSRELFSQREERFWLSYKAQHRFATCPTGAPRRVAFSCGGGRELLWRGSRIEKRTTQAESAVCDGAETVAHLVASRDCGRFLEGCGARGRVGECPMPREMGCDHQNLPRWQYAGVVGAGGRGRTVWTRENGTSGGGDD